MPRIAIAQIAMHWTTGENLKAMHWAMELARNRGAAICGFSELAVTGFHRHIGREAEPAAIAAGLAQLKAHAARLSLGIAAGAPSFGEAGAIFNSHFLIDEHGETAAVVSKQGLTQAEATFFQAGSARPVGKMQGLRCTAVICREVTDLDALSSDLPQGTVDLIFVPGALRQDPDKPITDPPEYVRDIQRLAAATRSYVVQTNWPNALNRPEESVDGGGSTVADPSGRLLFRLPARTAGVGVFTLGESHFEWHVQ